MKRFSLEELSGVWESYDRSVTATPDIDHFCSSSPWILAAARWLHHSPPALIANEGSAWVALIGREHWHPLETMWGLPSPLIGPEPEAAVELFLRLVREHQRPVVVTGLAPGSRLTTRLLEAAAPYFTLYQGPTTRRYVADAAPGVEAFLERRSAEFRRGLRKARRRCAEKGIRFQVEDGADPETSFERILDVERRSWKGIRGVGIDTEPMRSFYRDMNARLQARGARRLAFATTETGETLAYILGGVLGDTYRGLQFSYDHRYRELSLGNVSQISEIERVGKDGVARYDLGTEVRYKRRWADRVLLTVALVLHPA